MAITIAIASGKGGTGKTTISANLSVALSKFGKDVIVLDADIAMANLELVMGLDGKPITLNDVLAGSASVEQAIYEGPGGVKVVPAGVSLDSFKKAIVIKKDVTITDKDKKVQLLLNKLKNFKIEGDVVRTYTGPVVTTFEFKPLAHVKVSKILNLQDDLAMALKASTIRIQAPVPGKDVVGIEIPNNEIETIYLREILETDLFKTQKLLF